MVFPAQCRNSLLENMLPLVQRLVRQISLLKWNLSGRTETTTTTTKLPTRKSCQLAQTLRSPHIFIVCQLVRGYLIYCSNSHFPKSTSPTSTPASTCRLRICGPLGNQGALSLPPLPESPFGEWRGQEPKHQLSMLYIYCIHITTYSTGVSTWQESIGC